MSGEGVAELDRKAEKLCREIGIATMLVGVLPGLSALSGVALMLMGSGDVLRSLLAILASLLIAAAFLGLGYAMRRRVRWSFKVAMATFALIAFGGLAAVFVTDIGGAPLRFFVMLPLVFSATAYLAERAVAEHEQAASGRGPAF